MENLNECVDEEEEEEEEEGGREGPTVSSGPSMEWQLSIVYIYRAAFVKTLANIETLALVEV